MLVVGSSFGGPIAIVRDWKQFVKTSTSNKPVIRIFTSSGSLISTINWNSGSFLTMGWSDSEELLCIQDDGVVLRYDLFGKFQHSFTMGPEAKDCKVIDAQVFRNPESTGVAVMTTNQRIYFISNFKDPKTKLLPDLPSGYLLHFLSFKSRMSSESLSLFEYFRVSLEPNSVGHV